MKLLRVCLVSLWFSLTCFARVPLQQPHYVDGEHNSEFDEAEDLKLLHTSCEDLILQFPGQYKRPMLGYDSSEVGSRLQEDLYALQNPSTECADSRLLLFNLRSDCGFGAEMHWLTVALSAALATKRTLVLLEYKPWIYAAEPFCPRDQGTFSCYFQPLSSCVVHTKDDLNRLLGGRALSDIPVFTTKKLHELDSERIVQYTDDLQQMLDFPFFRTAPADYPHSDGLFWFRSQLVYYLWVLQERVEEHVTQRRVQIGVNEHDLFGVHARRGDKVMGSQINNREMQPLEYSRAFAISRAFAVNCHFDGVYTATKDPGYIAYIEQRVREGDSEGLSWLHDASMARRDNGWSTYNLLKGRLNNTNEALDVITDVALLASFRGFLGSFESNLSRLVAELGMAQFEMEFASAFEKQWMAFP